jgi:hypothetical protein
MKITKREKLLLTGTLVVAIGTTMYHLSRRTGLSDLQQTEALAVRVVDTQFSPRLCRVHYEIENQAARMADSVVLRLDVFDAQGSTIASNPLVHITKLAAAEKRTTLAQLPLPPNRQPNTATLTPVLVQWHNEETILR